MNEGALLGEADAERENQVPRGPCNRSGVVSPLPLFSPRMLLQLSQPS